MACPTPARGHMPFKGHRTQQEVREAEREAVEARNRCEILYWLGRDESERTQRRRRAA